MTADLFKKEAKKGSKVLGLSVFAFYLLHLLARFVYVMADLTQVAESRLALILLPGMAYAAVVFLVKFSFWLNIRKSYVILSVMGLLVFYWSLAGQNRGVRNLVLYREFKSAREYLEGRFPNKNEYILVAERANMYVPLKYTAINFRYLEKNTNKIHQNLRNKTYAYMVILQTVNNLDNKPISSCSVPDSLVLENIYETQIRGDQYLRVSICKSVL